MAWLGIGVGVTDLPVYQTLSRALVTLQLSGPLRNAMSSSGTILGATAGSTIASNVTGLTVNSGARTYTFDGTAAAGTTSNGLVETLVGTAGSPKSTAITVAVTAVLGTLTLSGSLTNGTSSSGTIIGATTGSTIVSNITGLTVDNTARTYAFDGTGAAGTTTNGLVETLTGATGSPKNSSLSVGSAAGAPSDPVTSNIVSGWTTGDNPPNWDTTYSGIYYDPADFTGDGLRIRWRLGGGSFTTEAWIPFDVTYLSDGFTYAFLTDGTLNAGGVFEVQVQAGRDFSAAIPSGTPTGTSNWSNSWTDTISAIVAPTPTYRYFRLYVTGTNTGTFTAVAEFEIAQSAAGADTTAGVTVTDSSHLSGAYVGSNTIDNNTATMWHSGSNTMPEWLVFDYGATSGNWVTPKEIRITSRNDNAPYTTPAQFKFQGSTDNSTWVDLLNNTADPLWSGSTETKAFAIP